MQIRIAIVVLLIGIFAAACMLLGERESEPSYQGKGYTTWLQEYSYESSKYNPDVPKMETAADAIRKIGRPGIPILLRLVKSERPSFKHWVLRIMGKNPFPTGEGSEFWKRTMARAGFEILGAEGREAVPALIPMLSGNNEISVTLCLAAMGPAAKDAVPALIQRTLAGEKQIVSMRALGEIHSRPELAIPFIISKLNSTNIPVKLAIGCLERFGPDAQLAIPALQPFLTNQDSSVNAAAKSALQAIHGKTPERRTNSAF